MNWFAKMMFDERRKSLGSKQNLAKTTIISFFILGIPVFIELFLILNYYESGYDLLDYPPYHKVVKIVGLLATFISIYIFFITVRSKLIQKISIILWLLIFYIPVMLEVICVRVTGTLLSNDFMFAIFNTHLKETLLIIQEYFIFICVNLGIVFTAFFLKSEKRYWNKRYSICAIALLFCSIFSSNFQSFNRVILAFFEHIKDLKEIDQFCKMPTTIEGIKTKSKGKQTSVFVISESVDRKHMEIYGYNRPTTPHFEKIKDELFAFKDVTTAHVFTSAAVKSMLLLKNKSNLLSYTVFQKRRI